MSSPVPNPRVRRSIQDIQEDYESGNKKPLEDLMRAWKGIKELGPDDPNSFFMIGGYHGEPFRGPGATDSSYWGGYCNHGNVLFPTWHRAYMMRLENALRTIPGCEDVTLPYWDETSDYTLKYGIPRALTDEYFYLDNQQIPNPLRSFVLNRSINDQISGDDPNYSKPAGYETVRYPLSGLVGTPADQAATAAHNAKFPDYEQNVGFLNQNIINWLTSVINIDNQIISRRVLDQFLACLVAPNYTVFSNTTSAGKWNSDNNTAIMPLEQPHNNMHLAVGGYDVPTGPGAFDASPIDGANGDMGENDTAALDPIFFFHHCFIDLVFWLWQQRSGNTNQLNIIAHYPGTNSSDSQGPVPGIPPNTELTIDTPLYPFKKADGTSYTSADCINVETQLGYTYEYSGILATQAPPVVVPGGARVAETARAKVIHVSGINRAAIRGSFLVSVYATINGQKHLLGTEGVLSRWSVKNCANCQTHLEVKAFFPLDGIPDDLLKDAQYEVVIRTRDGILTEANAPKPQGLATFKRKLYRLEVK
jgi:tyrosinase